MSDDRVLVEQRGHLLLIGLNRPDKRNAADLAMLHELARAYAVLHTDPELRVGVVHAVGGHFTGGLDLADVGPGLVSGHLDLVPSGSIDPWGLVTEPVAKPVVLAAQGTCLIWSVELALAADVVVAPTAPASPSWRWRAASWRSVARRSDFPGWVGATRCAGLLTGLLRRGRGAAHRPGAIQVVPHGEQVDAAIAIAERIAAQAPLAVQATLANAQLALHDPRAAADGLRRLVAMLAGTQDAQSAMTFSERKTD